MAGGFVLGLEGFFWGGGVCLGIFFVQIFFFPWTQSAYIHKSHSLWVCQDGTVYNRVAVFILVPRYTHYTKAQKEHRFTEGNLLASLPVMEMLKGIIIFLYPCATECMKSNL